MGWLFDYPGREFPSTLTDACLPAACVLCRHLYPWTQSSGGLWPFLREEEPLLRRHVESFSAREFWWPRSPTLADGLDHIPSGPRHTVCMAVTMSMTTMWAAKERGSRDPMTTEGCVWAGVRRSWGPLSPLVREPSHAAPHCICQPGYQSGPGGGKCDRDANN